MKKVCLFIAILIFTLKSNVIKAQHCPWDGVSLSILEIVDEKGKAIDGLKVTFDDNFDSRIRFLFQPGKKKGFLRKGN